MIEFRAACRNGCPTREGSMRDPMTWSFPLGRMFGIAVRVHVFFPVVVLGVILRAYTQKDSTVTLGEAGLLMLLLFVSVLLHEFGHCFAARSVDGDASEVLLWPLGGLAYCDLPHTPRAHLITALGGPAVNLVLCMVAAGALAFAQLAPPLNPLAAPFQPELYSWQHHITLRADKPPNATQPPVDEKAKEKKADVGPAAADRPGTALAASAQVTIPAAASLLAWQVVAAQLFWVNWFQLLINLLPGFPLDGGRVLQAILWARGDYRQATSAACYAGFVVMLVIGVFAIVANEVMAFALCLFVYVNCRQQLIVLETGGEDAPFGYDFSQGYTSLEGTQPPATTPRRKRPNWFQRWRQQRAARRAQREQESREAEERRMDDLLAKVQQEGIQSLTDEERRFLTRVSARYRGGKP
jgi:stage IV sporulation protein FB